MLLFQIQGKLPSQMINQLAYWRLIPQVEFCGLKRYSGHHEMFGCTILPQDYSLVADETLNMQIINCDLAKSFFVSASD
jgi:hypothetical protein